MIDRIGRIYQIRNYQKVEQKKKEKSTGNFISNDKVEISEEGKIISKIKNLPDVRTDKVERIKQEIKEGKYLTDEKLKEAVDRMIDSWINPFDAF